MPVWACDEPQRSWVRIAHWRREMRVMGAHGRLCHMGKTRCLHGADLSQLESSVFLGAA